MNPHRKPPRPHQNITAQHPTRSEKSRDSADYTSRRHQADKRKGRGAAFDEVCRGRKLKLKQINILKVTVALIFGSCIRAGQPVYLGGYVW